MRKCIRTRTLPLHTLKNIVLKNLILVVWKYAQMQKNTFLTTSDVKKFLDSVGLDVKKYLLKKLDSGGQEVCANAPEHVHYHNRG
jgi:hypothetical protein